MPKTTTKESNDENSKPGQRKSPRLKKSTPVYAPEKKKSPLTENSNIKKADKKTTPKEKVTKKKTPLKKTPPKTAKKTPLKKVSPKGAVAKKISPKGSAKKKTPAEQAPRDNEGTGMKRKGSPASKNEKAKKTKVAPKKEKDKKDPIAFLYSKAVPSCGAVNAALKHLGVQRVTTVCLCLKEGIRRGYYRLDKKNPLDQIVCSGECDGCGTKQSAKMRDILYQPLCGWDYGDGAKDAPYKCISPECEGAGLYAAELCTGDAAFNCGKFYNHCSYCPDFGDCLGDYRERHCIRCGNHYHGNPFYPTQCDMCNYMPVENMKTSGYIWVKSKPDSFGGF